MKKINEILIGTNNAGKYKEISELMPLKIRKYSLKEFNILSPKETGKTFAENSKLKALYFSQKTNLICISDDSGLEIDMLKGMPGIYSSRWAGPKGDFDLAIQKVFNEMSKIKEKWINHNKARFVCSLTLAWPTREIFTRNGYVTGKIIDKKKGSNGFGYDPIFVPKGFKKTFGELNPKKKMLIDHRYNAFLKIIHFFN